MQIIFVITVILKLKRPPKMNKVPISYTSFKKCCLFIINMEMITESHAINMHSMAS